MINEDIILEVFNNILEDKRFNIKCNRPGYKSPKQKLKEFMDEVKGGKEYATERYSDDQDWQNKKDEHPFVSPVGEMQRVQQELQREIDYTLEDRWVAKAYNTSMFIDMNDYLYKKEGYESAVWHRDMDGYDKKNPRLHPCGEWVYNDGDDEGEFIGGGNFSIPEMCDMLSATIQKSPRVQEAVCSFRYGEFPSDLKEGDIGKFDGFTSASYNPTVVSTFIKQHEDDVGGWMNNNRKIIRMWTPKNTPCLVMDTESLGTQDFQSEILYDKGQKYIVIKTDANSVDILLYNND